jgi:hypothetical protein
MASYIGKEAFYKLRRPCPMNEALQLIAWIFVFAIVASGICVLLTILVRQDTTKYDMEFVWDGKYTLEELELSKNKSK